MDLDEGGTIVEEIQTAKIEIRRGKSKLKIGKDPRSSYRSKCKVQ